MQPVNCFLLSVLLQRCLQPCLNRETQQKNLKAPLILIKPNSLCNQLTTQRKNHSKLTVMKKHQIPIIDCHVDIGTEWIWQLILEAQFCKTTRTDSKQQLINKGPCNASDNTDLWGKLTHCCYTVPFFHCACWALNHVLSFVKNWLQAVLNGKPGNFHSKPIDTMVR